MSTAIFSLVDAVLLRMLLVRDPQRLVEITRTGGGTLSYPMFEEIRDRNQVFSGVLLLSGGRFAASAQLGGADLGDIHFSPVSGSYFDVLGVSPVIGWTLSEEDLDASNTGVISYGFWQRAFAGDPAVLGKTLRVGGGSRAYTIVGVAPQRFTGVATGQPVDLWVPVTRSRNRVAMMFRVIARMKPSISENTALANAQLLARQWSAEWGFEAPMRVEVMAASGGLTQNAAVVSAHHPTVNVPVLWWRSVGHTHNAFVMETLIDELATRARIDPITYRRKLLKADAGKLRRALDLMDENSAAWRTKLPKAHAVGISCHESFETGVAVNPLTIESQFQAGVAFGVSQLMAKGAVTLKDGPVGQRNFDGYTPPYINDTVSREKT